MQLEPATSSRRVLVTDAVERSILATCRGLDTAGYAVSAATFRGQGCGQWSRHCSDRVRITDPRVDAAGFMTDLRSHLERHPCAMLVPGSDFSLHAVSRRREVLDGLTQLGLPSHDVVERSFNREVLAAAAARAGLEPAAAVHCATVDEALTAAGQFGYPVLMKSISTVRDLGDVVAAGPSTRRIANEAELRAAVAYYGDGWLVQRLSYGRTLSFGGVMAGRQLIGLAVSEYLRTWPPMAGNVSFSVTIEPPPGLERAVEILLREVGWEGMFELEVIEDDRGAITPIDLNPRPYGSMSLAIASGANLPGLWCDWVLGRARRDAVPSAPAAPLPAAAVPYATAVAPPPVSSSQPVSVLTAAAPPVAPARARPGRYYRWEDADLRHLLWQLRHGHGRAFARALRPRPNVVHAHFQAGDPLPMLVRVFTLMTGKIRARMAGLKT